MRKFTAAFAGITAGFIALFTATASAEGAPQHRSDCSRVAKADQPLCRVILGQQAYGWVNPDGSEIITPRGRVLIRELTHDGLTYREMHHGVVSINREYRLHVTAVPVNMNSIVKKCGNTDGQWVVSFVDEDGKPGGVKLTKKVIDCA